MKILINFQNFQIIKHKIKVKNHLKCKEHKVFNIKYFKKSKLIFQKVEKPIEKNQLIFDNLLIKNEPLY